MNQILEKSFFYLIFDPNLCEMNGKKLQFFLRIINVYQSFQYTYPKYLVLTIIVFHRVFLFFSSILKSFIKCLNIRSFGIQTNLFFEITKKIHYLWKSPFLLSKNELIMTNKLNKTTKQIHSTCKISTLSINIMEFMFVFYLAIFENLDEPKKHIDNKINFLKKAKKHSIVPLLWLDDNEIIWDVGVGCEKESIDQGRSYVDKNINISLCFFKRYSTYSGDGGVIYVNGGSYSMYVNNSMFYNCVCSNQGGSIFFSSSNSYLRMICANSCSASYYHFAYIQTSQMNQIEFLSVSKCSHTSSGYHSIYLFSGNQRLDNTNSSMNNAYQGSGIYTQSPSSFTSSRCAFSNNKVSHSICLFFNFEFGTISMSYANIVHNNSPSLGLVTVNGGGIRKMMYCIFHNNQNNLFCVWGGSLEVSHSFIDHSGSFSTFTAVSTANNNSFNSRITYQLIFFNSLHCPTDIPPPKRTLEKSPIRSLGETIRRTNEETLRMTYERTMDQTIRETLKETIPRTYDELECTNQIAKRREISVIFSFLYAVIIQMIS